MSYPFNIIVEDNCSELIDCFFSDDGKKDRAVRSSNYGKHVPERRTIKNLNSLLKPYTKRGNPKPMRIKDPSQFHCLRYQLSKLKKRGMIAGYRTHKVYDNKNKVAAHDVAVSIGDVRAKFVLMYLNK